MRHLKALFADDATYFTLCKRSIAAHNGRMLADGCVLYALVLTFYTLLSLFTQQPALLRTMYYAFDGFHLLLCAAVFTRPVRWKESYRATQVFCAVLELSILGFFALEGAVATPTQHSLYVPIAILLLQLLFIHRAIYSLLVILLYTASFAALSWVTKTPEAAANDLYIAIATFLSATMGYYLVSKLRRNEQHALAKFESLSKTDALTGLHNKATLDQLCQLRISESRCACTLLVIDLDDFKSVNDECGHDVGDEVLHSFGAELQQTFRSNDIIGRFGGDEFVVLMDGCENLAVVRERVSALQKRIGQLRFSVPGLTICFSAGVALQRAGDDFRTLFSRADRALYTAKRAGKNGFFIETDDH